MKKILICPGERSSVAFLAQACPLVNLPILGESLLHYWMDHLATNGVKEVLILATDRPEQVKELLDDGRRWGVQVEVVSELRELSVEEAYAKYCLDGDFGKLDLRSDVIKLDFLPGLSGYPLFNSYSSWYEAIQAWYPFAPGMNRIGLREIQPGVWVGMRTEIDKTAVLKAPCWLADNVYVGPDVIVGPHAVIESRAVIESTSEIIDSVVGPDTFVGSLTRVQNSIAWGSTLINWRNGSCTQVPDSFLMCSLNPSTPKQRTRNNEKRVESYKFTWVRPWHFFTSTRPKLPQ